MMLQINHKPKPWGNIVKPGKSWSPHLTAKRQLEHSPRSPGKNALSCPLTPSAVWHHQPACCKTRVEVDGKTSPSQQSMLLWPFQQGSRSRRAVSRPAETPLQQCSFLPALPNARAATRQSWWLLACQNISTIAMVFPLREEDDTFSLSVLNAFKHVPSWYKS